MVWAEDRRITEDTKATFILSVNTDDVPTVSPAFVTLFLRATTQIKAFGFLGCTPRRPFRLTGKARRDAHRRLAGESSFITRDGGGGSGDVTARLDKSSEARAQDQHSNCRRGKEEEKEEDSVVEALQGEGGYREGETGITGRSHLRKMLTCGMCGVLLCAEDVSCKMTAKMIRDTLIHVSWRYSAVWCASTLPGYSLLPFEDA